MNTKRNLSQDSLEISRRINILWRTTKKGLGLTQVQAAKKLGMSQSAFSQIMSGTVAVNSVMVLNITALLNADLSKLCKGLKEFEHLVRIRPVIGSMLPVTITITGKKVENKSIQAMLEPTEGAFAVEVDSDEYSPRYNVGDYAIVNPNRTIAIGNEVLLHYKNEECLVRVVDSIDTNGQFTAHHPSKPGGATTFDLNDQRLDLYGVILGVTFG